MLLRNDFGKQFQLPTIVCIGLPQFGIFAVETREKIRADRRQRDEVADQPAARMRHDADAGVARQCAEQFDGVVDRAVAQRAVLEGVDAIVEEPTQRLPLRLRVLAEERTEAAACGGRGAVDEDKNWLVDVGVFKAHWCGSVLPGLAGGVLPRVQAGAGLEAALDDADEELGGKPGGKLHRKIDAEISRQLCQVGELGQQ